MYSKSLRVNGKREARKRLRKDITCTWAQARTESCLAALAFQHIRGCGEILRKSTVHLQCACFARRKLASELLSKHEMDVLWFHVCRFRSYFLQISQHWIWTFCWYWQEFDKSRGSHHFAAHALRSPKHSTTPPCSQRQWRPGWPRSWNPSHDSMAAGPMANQRGHHVPEPGQFWGSNGVNGDTETPRGPCSRLWSETTLGHSTDFDVLCKVCCRPSYGHQEQQILVLGRKLFRPGAGAQFFLPRKPQFVGQQVAWPILRLLKESDHDHPISLPTSKHRSVWLDPLDWKQMGQSWSTDFHAHETLHGALLLSSIV